MKLIKKTRSILAILSISLLAGCFGNISAKQAPVRIVKETPFIEPTVSRPEYYKIKRGDTLAKIALEQGLNYREVAVWNAIPDPNKIIAGDVIRLSPPPTAAKINTVTTNKVKISSIPAPQLTENNAASQQKTFEPEQSSRIVTKHKPQAEIHPYSEEKLAQSISSKSTNSTNSTNVANVAKPEKPKVTPTPTIVSSNEQSANLKTRERFGVAWSWPTNGKILTSYTSKSRGIDIAGDKGQQVLASADGTVVYTGTGIKSYGKLVIIKHENEYLSAYGHNNKIIVKEGQQVARGEKIATLGRTGTERNMLRFEIRKGGTPVDPVHFLPQP